MRVVAIDRFEYANKLRLPGEEFETDNDEHARLLEIAKRVKPAETRALKSDDELPEHSGSNKRNRYGTRRLKAEE